MTNEDDKKFTVYEKTQSDTNEPKQHSGSLSNQMFNIRLSIPKIWIEDLERLRRNSLTTRLALLKRFIQE